LKLDFPAFDEWCKSVKVTRIATVARKKEAVKEIYKQSFTQSVESLTNTTVNYVKNNRKDKSREGCPL